MIRLWPIIFMIGCSCKTPLINAGNSRVNIVVAKHTVKIICDRDMDDNEIEFATKTIEKLELTQFKDINLSKKIAREIEIENNISCEIEEEEYNKTIKKGGEANGNL